MISAIKRLARLYRINRVLLKHGLDELVYKIRPNKALRFLKCLFYWNSTNTGLNRAERIRLAIIELGPIYIKFGQMLSTRRDLLPPDIADELEKLQDDVPPYSATEAREIIESSLKAKIVDIFSDFSDIPLASASVAQVHPAKLNDGTDVVVKVLRPNIRQQISRDIDLLKAIAVMSERYSSEARRLKVTEVVFEFEKIIFDELNLMREAANASQLRRNFLDSEMLYVPRIYWDYTQHSVLVMERIYGIPISDVQTLKKSGVDFKKLAEYGVKIFFTQVFRDCFFHADMHPGNVFVDATNPSEPKYIAVDFGVIGTLTRDDQYYLASNFLAFFDRDYYRIAKLHIESGWVSSEVRIDEFESAIRTVCEPIFERPLKEISFGNFLLNLFTIARRFNMEVQPQLVLLQKTLLSIEGLGRQLYPDLDLWITAKPFLEDWLKSKAHPKTVAKQIKDNALFWADRYAELPDLIYKNLVSDIEHKKSLQGQIKSIESIHESIRRLQSQFNLTVLIILLGVTLFLLKDLIG